MRGEGSPGARGKRRVQFRSRDGGDAIRRTRKAPAGLVGSKDGLKPALQARAERPAGEFRLLGAADLTGFEIVDMDFWNGGVMLAWGGTGLYRIDLAEALKPAPPEP